MFLRKFLFFSAPKDEFRKPSWIDVSDTDDELFDGKSKFLFQIFTNPIELQKHFDNQMQQVLKSMKELEESEDVFDPPTISKDEYLKPGFDEHFMEQFRKSSISDTDLDGEIYADQLHSLLQRIQPEVKEKINKKDQKLMGLNSFAKPKMTDEQKIFGRIHGSIVDEEVNKPIVRKKEVVVPRMPPHFGGVFEGAYQVRFGILLEIITACFSLNTFNSWELELLIEETSSLNYQAFGHLLLSRNSGNSKFLEISD